MSANRLSAGDRLFSGVTVTASQAAAYNAISDRIASFERAGRPMPDHLLNGRHNLFSALAFG